MSALGTSQRTSFVAECLLFAGWHLTRWRIQPLIPIQSVVFPTLLLAIFHLLTGESMVRLIGSDNLDGLVPMCALAGGIVGALGAGFSIPAERASGLLSRLWTFPVHRASALTGRLIAEAARALLSTALITAAGVAFGMRFDRGWSAVIPFLLVPVAVVLAFAMVVTTVALAVGPEGTATFAWLGTVSVGLVFGSAGVAPVELFPQWLQPVIRYQPMSPAIETMRALAEGGAVWGPLVVTVGWVLGFAAVFGPAAIRNYRIAAEAGN